LHTTPPKSDDIYQTVRNDEAKHKAIKSKIENNQARGV